MRYSTRLSDAIHILLYIRVHPGRPLSSAEIARSLQTNPSCVRQIMMRLRRGGLLNSVTGHPRPALSRPPREISLLDVYRAVEGEAPLLRCDPAVNSACPAGVCIQAALQESYDEIQRCVEEKMNAISLADILHAYHRRAAQSLPPEQDGGP